MDYLQKAILVYIILINIVSAAVCIFDKHRAKKGGRRVPEKNLFLLCFLGGGVAMYITMRAIRHKTLHKRFMIGIPCIILFQIAVILVLSRI